MKKQIYITFILTTLLVNICKSQNLKETTKSDYTLKTLSKKVDAIVLQKMEIYQIPGLSIGIIKNDSVIYSKGYGIKSINSKNLVTKNTNFHTASISKLFTAQAIMILAEQKKLNLEDKLITIIPDLKYKDERIKNITIKSLLNHTSGLPDVYNYNWKNNNQSDNSLKDYVLNLNLKLKTKPETEYLYSNLGYNILGYVVEKVSKTNFDIFIKENILNPNQMYNSDFRYFKIADSLKSDPHSKKMLLKKIFQRKIYPYTREQAPSSTLNSSVNDLNKWMISILNPENSQQLNQMTQPSFSKYPYIGLGFQLSNIYDEKTIGHYGGDKGYRSYLIMLPKKRFGLVLLANCDYNEDFRQEILHSILKQMLKEN
jgi:CubicO group peptidase (beta-lactamase class C family)